MCVRCLCLAVKSNATGSLTTHPDDAVSAVAAEALGIRILDYWIIGLLDYHSMSPVNPLSVGRYRSPYFPFPCHSHLPLLPLLALPWPLPFSPNRFHISRRCPPRCDATLPVLYALLHAPTFHWPVSRAFLSSGLHKFRGVWLNTKQSQIPIH